MLNFFKSQVRVIVYDWALKTFSPDETDNEMSKATRIDVSQHITDVSFSKNMEGPSGNFEVKLDDTRNWKEIIRKDSWCVIYMSNGEDIGSFVDASLSPSSVPDFKFSRGLCYIERVNEDETQVEGNGEEDLFYSVSGRDFGKIYEDTEVWLNFFKSEATFIKTLTANLKISNIATTDKLVELGHKLFFSAKFDITGGVDFAETAQQWLLPRAMLDDLGIGLRIGDSSYFGLLENLFQFSEVNTTIPIDDPLKSINGNAWAKLKEWSVEELNELYCELDQGKPTLVYRAIPWGINSKGYPNLSSNIQSFKAKIDADDITLTGDEIFHRDMGEDAHNRYNHFYAWSSANRHSAFDNISELKGKPSKNDREYPYVNKASIKRHGFKPMHVDLNTITYSVKATKNGKVDSKRLLEYNEVLYDYWSPAVYFESGSISIIGRNDIKIGKAIKFDNNSGSLSGKAFYIEGYSDEFIQEESGEKSWTQTLQLTRGIEYDRLKESFTDSELEAVNEDRKTGTFVKD